MLWSNIWQGKDIQRIAKLGCEADCGPCITSAGDGIFYVRFECVSNAFRMRFECVSNAFRMRFVGSMAQVIPSAI